ncbi:GNAT family N-acetyltransferase [Vibrio parahaemolyticus]|uniref:GNAT family N-acetyltransferase n=1 Tax=Vibrio parahaemolyticus TaxID=670 RepID=UPI0005440BE6|nr:GNAT family N-acetyltransferase [Vibrio parahaemolyticus]KHF17009.1 acetyltransferase [Vibrio parahaemolyticus]
MELVVPSLKWEPEFAEFYEDFACNDPVNAEYYLEGALRFSNYVTRLSEESQGINLRVGYVPCDHFWLVSAQKEIVGAVRVRHNIDNDCLSQEAGHIGYDISPSFRGLGYGKLMLSLALPKAKALGISKALITADEDNMASRKVIEANDGKLESIVFGKTFSRVLTRYWVDCK